MRQLLLIAIALLFVFLAVACQDPVADQARAATLAATALSAGGEAVDRARTEAFDAAEREHPRDPEHDAALDAVAQRFEPLDRSLDTASEAVLTWMGAIELAARAGDGGDLLMHVAQLGARAVLLTSQALDLGHTLGADIDSSLLPTWVRNLARNLAGNGGSR